MASGRSWLRLWVALAASVGLLLLAPSARAVVLYDQTEHPKGLVSSQDFAEGSIGLPTHGGEVSYNAFDTTVADDFTVPSGESWTIDRVDVLGVDIPFPTSNGYSVGITLASTVRLYEASGTLPGASVFTSISGPPPPFMGINPNFALPVSGAPALPPGHYWVSVQGFKAFDPLGQWSWKEVAAQSGDPAAFENPGNGFGTGCTTFMPKRAQCIPGARLDQAFRLNGTVGSPAVSPPAPETPQPPPPEGGPPLPDGAPVPIVGTPSNEFGFRKVKKNEKKGTATLTVEVPGTGNLKLARTNNIKPDQGLAEGGSFIVGAGKKQVSIKPKGKAKEKLNTTGEATVKAKITYTPVMTGNVTSESGDPNTESKKIKLIKR